MSESYDSEMGLLTPLSHVSQTMLEYTDKMNFGQRWCNTMYTIFGWFVRRLVHNPLQTNLVKEHFSHLEPLPSIDELRKNISIIFVNAHRSMMYPRPSMPGLIYIGGKFRDFSPPLTFEVIKIKFHISRCSYQTSKAITIRFAEVFG